MTTLSRTRPLRRLNSILDRDDLALALQASTNPKEIQMGQFLASTDDRWSKLSIAGIAVQLGLTHSQIMTAYRTYKRQAAIVEAARQAPAIVRDIAGDARNREVTCPTCEGNRVIEIPGTVPVQTRKCIPCEGTGKVIRHGDPVARKQVLEIMELSGKAPTMIDARGGQMVVTSEGSLEEMLKAMRNGKANGGGNVPGVIDGTTEVDGSDEMENSSQ